MENSDGGQKRDCGVQQLGWRGVGMQSSDRWVGPLSYHDVPFHSVMTAV